MLNRYFDSQGNIDFIYANVVVKNIYFALISLNYILYKPDYDIGVYHDEHTYYFFHIQSLLTACGNISNVFYNTGGHGGNTATQRGRRLRNTFNINKSLYPLVFQKEVRNTNAHFDERYEQFGGNIGDYNLLDHNTDLNMRTIIMQNPHLRTYDKESGIYYTYNNKMNPISYDLNQLNCELRTMLSKLTENPIFESGWVDSPPEETIR